MTSSPKIRDFELKAKLGTKSLEQSIKLREEGNRFFQAEQTMQSILFYNKSIAMAPHPTVEEYFAPPPPPDKVNSGLTTCLIFIFFNFGQHVCFWIVKPLTQA